MRAHRILTVSKGWVAVTAPQAAMPPAMKALGGCQYLVLAASRPPGGGKWCSYPAVVDMSLCSGSNTQVCNLLTDQAVANCELQVSHKLIHMLPRNLIWVSLYVALKADVTTSETVSCAGECLYEFVKFRKARCELKAQNLQEIVSCRFRPVRSPWSALQPLIPGADPCNPKSSPDFQPTAAMSPWGVIASKT